MAQGYTHHYFIDESKKNFVDFVERNFNNQRSAGLENTIEF